MEPHLLFGGAPEVGFGEAPRVIVFYNGVEVVGEGAEVRLGFVEGGGALGDGGGGEGGGGEEEGGEYGEELHRIGARFEGRLGWDEIGVEGS